MTHRLHYLHCAMNHILRWQIDKSQINEFRWTWVLHRPF
jgi:hypothetical protein